MSGDEISVRCSHCGVRLKCSGNRSRIKCPKCQQYSEIQASAAFGTIPSSVATPPASPPARIFQPIVTVETKAAPFAESDSDHAGKLRILLANGLAQGVLTAAVLYIVLPEFGLTGSRLVLVLAGVVA